MSKYIAARWLLLTLLLSCLQQQQQAGAQTDALKLKSPRVASRPDEPTKGEIRSKRNEVSSQLNAALAELGRKQGKQEEPVSELPVSVEVDLLRKIDAVLARQQTAESKKNQLLQRVSELESELNLWHANRSNDVVTSFVNYDRIKNDLESSQSRLESAEAAHAASLEVVESSRLARESKDAALRLARETLSSNGQTEKQVELELAVKTAELEARLAEETLNLNRILSENDDLNKKALSLTIKLLTTKASTLADSVQFSESDLQEILVQIERQESSLRQSAVIAESRLQFAEQKWTDARRRLENSGENPATSVEVAAFRVARQLCQQQFDVISKKRERLANARQIWNQRSRVFNDEATNEELSEWSGETRDQIAILERERRVQVLNSDDVRKEIATLESQLQAAGESVAASRQWLDTQIARWREFLLTNDENLASIDAMLDLHRDLQNEIEGNIQHWTISERLASAWDGVRKIWSAELASIDDRPITVGKIVVGILLLFLGFFAARLISRTLGNRLLTRMGLNEGAVAALKSLTFYSLVVVFTLLALRVASVPLTVFTLLGGALAIGVGFGSQAIINNFISGLILLAERPIQVGDLVRVDGLVGNVTHIGARSTRVRTGDNLDIIVPNSKFLETNVLNYTLADDKFRSHITVGLAYGSPTREATRLLIKAADEHGEILVNPKPFVWFRDFGESSLTFELHVWIKVRTLGERLRIESDLRYRIDNLFREAGIVIAFPQRDIHLDTTRPLDIRLMANQEAVGLPPQMEDEKKAA